MLRILIVDDQKSIRETIKAVLEPEPDFEVVATADNGLTAIEFAKKCLPDLMLVDLEMPSLNGMQLTKIISQDFSHIRVIVLSTHDEDEYIQQSLQAGAMGYLLKGTPADDLKEAIRFVSRGYNQFSPGLLHKVIPQKKIEPAKTDFGDYLDAASLDFKELTLVEPGKNKNQRHVRKSWTVYFPYWLLGNIVLWGIALLYLIFKSPIYTSKWSISLPSHQNSSSVSISNIGSVSSNTESLDRNHLFDPRENYKFLLGKKEIMSLAADRVGISVQEFGKPDVEIVDNTTMMELSIEGNTPQEALQKAIAISYVLEQKLQELRQTRISKTDLSLQDSLEKSEQYLRDARQRLAEFKLQWAIGFQDKAENLSSNVENLRLQKAEIKAQLEQAHAQAQRLSNSLGISTESAQDALILYSDSLFQQYLSNYTRNSAELTSLESRFKSSNPIVIDRSEETAAARNALLKRGEVLLGRRLSSDMLQQLNLRTGDEKDSYRGSLLKNIVFLQSEAKELAARAAKLEQQITQLETAENGFVQQRARLNKLEQDVKFAETVYSSNLDKSRLAKSNLYNAYPQIQVAIQPNLPKKPSSPNPILVYLGTFIGSIFLTTAIAYFWASSSEPVPTSSDKNNHNHKAIVPIL
ncbi:conserved hypothetical protein [Hyella patelloides LEGE 07179]|uniref:Response regulatory domain-containing protein n=1 Tax=Hyella patelloides LEGE 07179 TaxID=945734 RepID=A0A563VZT4_9CYAN|nr:response regulator [Hyella patelloides]VEP16877.1 conserved hypothetical protein [Hyella patelloides LEGE 07179]